MLKLVPLAIMTLALLPFAKAADLTSATTVSISPGLELRVWSKSAATAAGGVALSQSQSGVNCGLSLSSNAADSTVFKLVGTKPVQEGSVYLFTPTQIMNLKIVSASTAQPSEKGDCNGEPELCDSRDYVRTLISLSLTDEKSNEWSLLCLSDKVLAGQTTPGIELSDVKIQGVSIQ